MKTLQIKPIAKSVWYSQYLQSNKRYVGTGTEYRSYRYRYSTYLNLLDQPDYRCYGMVGG